MNRARQIAAAMTSLLFGCASPSTPPRHLVHLTQDTLMTPAEGTTEMKTAGETIELSESPVLLEAPGRVGLLLVPVRQQTDRELRVSLRNLHEFGGASLERNANEALLKLFDDIYEVQRLIGLGQREEALVRVDELLGQHPTSAPLRLLKASCLLLKNDRGAAAALVDSVLKEHPKNPAARDLKIALDPAGEEKKEGEPR